MLALPNDLTDYIKLADWLELSALNASDKNASAGDLISALDIPSDSGDESKEVKALTVMNEIEQRAKATGEAYPFEIINGQVLQTKANCLNQIAYIFCLCLSYYGYYLKAGDPINPWFVFEDLACIAAREYLQGEVLKFGAGKRLSQTNFIDAVNDLAKKIGEGEGFKTQRTFNAKDDKLDLAVWKHFADRSASKIIMFGQCAAGANWADKISELDPDAFWDQWMNASQVTQKILRSFYIPHRIESERWNFYARRTGVLFDRCRIAYWAHDQEEVLKDARYSSWCLTIIPNLDSQ